ncbi:alpha/beta hydrolase [Microbacterium sp. M3]|uniref:Alpha/beta hydrolase n=1 Tax=Microbacterium arthrosphaerae TaxID=792652 RepID=A0ABU4H3T0_9MICO|nr:MULTISPECIES: alpha/beta hydrolase [Microbacterium]MDW4573993.1 alpha/beta hydrolase [Microbacterium arthrosphaerae]MDW7607848.1 alpha/beta hydrolase [Microbacterium sp. M3]
MGAMKPPGGNGRNNTADTDTRVESLPDAEGVRHRFVDLPGLRMHVAEAGDGPPLLMLHGFPQHWWAWRKVIPELAAHYRVICPDLRGAGWTDAPPDGYHSEQLVDDIVALLDALQIDRVDLMGYDSGGIVGYRLCLRHPERVRRYVNFATPHPYAAFHARVLLNMWRLWPMFAIAARGVGPRLLGRGRQRLPRWQMTSDTSDPSVFPPDAVEQYVARFRDPARARAGSRLYRDLMFAEGRRSMSGEYNSMRLRTPTLTMYGAVLYDNDLPDGQHPEVLDGYQDHADDLTVERVRGFGYYLAEEKPEFLVGRAREFLQTAS